MRSTQGTENMISPVLRGGAAARDREVREGGSCDVQNQQILGGIAWRLREQCRRDVRTSAGPVGRSRAGVRRAQPRVERGDTRKIRGYLHQGIIASADADGQI